MNKDTTYLSVWLKDGSVMMIDDGCLDDVNRALLSKSDDLVSLKFAHGHVCCHLRSSYIQGWSLSTPTSREDYRAYAKLLEDEEPKF